MNNLIIWAVSSLLLTANQASADSLSALDILKKNEATVQVQNYEATVSLSTKGGNKRDNEKIFTIWRKLQPDNIHFKMLTRFHKPATIKNEGILFIEAANDKSDVLLYLPNFKKIRRIENNNQGSSFMGSVFSYADISPSHYMDLNTEKLKDEKCPGAKLDCYVLKTSGKTLKIRQRSGYEYTKAWIRKDNFTLTRTEGYSKKNKLIKTITMEDYALVDQKNNRYVAQLITGVRASDQATTIFKISELKFGKVISDSVFSRENLENP